MKNRFGFNLTKTIIKELNNMRFFVRVPKIALYKDEDLAVNESTRLFVNGVQVEHNNKTLLNRYTGEDETLVTKKSNSTIGLTYTEDGVLPDSGFVLENARLSIAEIIEVFADGFTVMLVNKDDLVKLTTKLSDTLDRLEYASDAVNAKKFIPIIKNFYETMVGMKGKTIKTLLNTPKKSTTLGFDDDGINNNEIDTRSISGIDLSDIVVN